MVCTLLFAIVTGESKVQPQLAEFGTANAFEFSWRYRPSSYIGSLSFALEHERHETLDNPDGMLLIRSSAGLCQLRW